MRQAMSFTYNGTHSSDMGVFIASTDTGLFDEIFLPGRELIEKKVRGRDKVLLQRVEHTPLSFSLSFVLKDWDDYSYLRKVARWLFQDEYLPLVFETNPERIFYAIVVGDSSLFHNGAREGYVELNIRCNSPYSYTPDIVENNISFRNEDNEIIISSNFDNFDNGIYENTRKTANGITVDAPLNNWGEFYDKHVKWGDLDEYNR